MKNNRETIDIEALLTRAYREKRVHTLNAGASTALGLTWPRAPGATFSASDKVDTSSFSARMAAEIRELQARLIAAPSSLIDLHDLVLGLPDFYIERGASEDFIVWDIETAERSGNLITVGQDGALIVQVRRRGGRGPGREDFLPVGAARRLTTLTTSTIVVLAGSYGDRPYVPELVVIRRRPVYVGADKRAAGYEPVYETPLHSVVEDRATYAVWHAALGMLVAALADSAEFEVTGPSAPGEPWVAPARILIGERGQDWHTDEQAETAKKRLRKGAKVPRKTKEDSIVAAA